MLVRKLPRLNIGCGAAPKTKEEGWINCDLHAGKDVDMVFDACGRWPFVDQSILEINSDHTLEHIADPMAFFREAWRVLIPNGQLRIMVPYGWHKAAWWDLTHLRPWVAENFAILQPGYDHFTRNLQQHELGFAFWVANAILILDRPWSRMWRFHPLRPMIKWAINHLLNVVRALRIEAFKTEPKDSRSVVFGGDHHPAVVPVTYGVLEHEYYGRNADGLEVHTLLVFTDAKRGTATAGH